MKVKEKVIAWLLLLCIMLNILPTEHVQAANGSIKIGKNEVNICESTESDNDSDENSEILDTNDSIVNESSEEEVDENESNVRNMSSIEDESVESETDITSTESSSDLSVENSEKLGTEPDINLDNAEARQKSSKESILSELKSAVSINIEKGGLYNYRDDYLETRKLEINLDESLLNCARKEKIYYIISITNSNVIDCVYKRELHNSQRFSEAITGTYTPDRNKCNFTILGIGKSTIDITVSYYDDSGLICNFKISKEVVVSNSGINDNDIDIKILSDDGNELIKFETDDKKTCVEKLEEYLRLSNKWINASINIDITDIGKRYYDVVKIQSIENQENTSNILNFNSSLDSREGTHRIKIWLENTKNGASTKDMVNGTKVVEYSVDNTIPIINQFEYSNNYYEPTSSETKQYYSEEFKIKGIICDNSSGIKSVEYTTNYDENSHINQWTSVPTNRDEDGNIVFNISLKNGDYKAIAVRAWDYAGNVSENEYVKNDKGEFINIIVDDTAPVLSVKAMISDIEYNKENINEWTNQPVEYKVCYADGCEYAGIYTCEYAYNTILDVKKSKLDNCDLKWSELDCNKVDNKIDIESVCIGNNELENRNGYYYFVATSKSGVKSTIVEKRILLQQTLPEKKGVIESGASLDRKNEWYNKKSGVPIISFEYPEYDDGNKSGEYGAPITLHYSLEKRDEYDVVIKVIDDAKATIGVMREDDFTDGCFKVCEDILDNFKINFDYDKETGYAQDGIYTLKYWITDVAGNASDITELKYSVDTHEPTEMKMVIAGEDMAIDSQENVVYERFYQNAVSGTASANYGISGKEYINVLKAKKIGEWNSADNLSPGDSFDISPCTRCFLYVLAEDKAGNITEGWTRGLVVDNQIPTGDGNVELIVEPIGANEHGFYNKDIEVSIKVKDAPDDDNCAAIMDVSASIGKDGTDTIADKQLFSFTKELPSEDEMVNYSSYTTVQTIDAKANESNEAYIEVVAIDRAENAKTSMQLLKIDVTKPEVEIAFDNNNAINGNFYNANRTATIYVKEKNFDSSQIDINVTKNGAAINISELEWRHDEDNHYANIVFSEDGDYTLSMKCTDLADNESDEVVVDGFTIDKTMPIVKMEMTDEQGNLLNPFVYNEEEYINKAAVLTITVEEHNFNKNDFTFNVNAGIKLGEWSHNGDIHTAKASFTNDENYSIDCAYTDMAGNMMEGVIQKHFVLDTVAPLLAISGVADQSANAGEITPVVTVLDLNYTVENGEISVLTGRGESVTVENTVSAINDGIGIGYTYTLTDMTSKEDNVYYLNVRAVDLAGNESTLSYRFSLNRNGSTYDITNIKDIIDNYYNVSANIRDIKIVEMNVDKVEEFNMYVSRNGEILSTNQVNRKPVVFDKDKIYYSVEASGSENTGYMYTYIIYKDNFTKEGNYKLGFYSKDRAGNEVNNTLNEESENISFVVDDTEPKVIIEGVESGQVYEVKSQTVNVMVADNFKLNDAKFTLVNEKGEVIDSWNYFDLTQNEGDLATITIPEYDGKLSLLYKVKDAAGNEVQTFADSETALSGFLVTTDKVVEVLNKSVNVSSDEIIIFSLVIVGLAVLFILYRKRQAVNK